MAASSSGEQPFGGGRVGGVLHHHGGGGADGPERAGRQGGLEEVGGARHREVPPDVTVGLE